MNNKIKIEFKTNEGQIACCLVEIENYESLSISSIAEIKHAFNEIQEKAFKTNVSNIV